MALKLFGRKKVLPGRVILSLSGEALAMIYMKNGVLVSAQLCDLTTGTSWYEWLAERVSALELKGVPCTLQLHSEYYQLLLAETPNVPEEELEQALPWRIKDLLHEDVAAMAVDYFKIPEDAYKGRQAMLYAVASRKVDLMNWINAIEEAGLLADKIDILELGLNNLPGAVHELDTSYAVLYLGLQSGVLIAGNQHNVYLCRNIDVGLEAIISTLPEEISEFVGGTHLDRLLLEVQRSFDYFESQVGKGRISDLYVMPIAREATRISDFLRSNLAPKLHLVDVQTLITSEELLEENELCFLAPAISASLPLRESALT